MSSKQASPCAVPRPIVSSASRLPENPAAGHTKGGGVTNRISGNEEDQGPEPSKGENARRGDGGGDEGMVSAASRGNRPENGKSSGLVTNEQANHLNLFNNRQQPKKKRKSRTAFTNQQIFELEKRFLYQKYLSPADRDEIAAQLGLSNAQVITWFQNRRAKLKRDMEELKKDVQTVNPLLVAQHHKTFLENVQDLGILKKRPLPSSMDEKS
ncbi:hypothetical protein E2986_11095 [Frieseomelitta varia]|uniref:Homeobox domain-containing protein n=1 Tax=Frieseomelitta varia TaxID=561572 RepID=A0A833RUQ4_9HYME|nr:hypothetical protein E2986_11095 [Frieseomelitta varia]